MQMVPYDFGAVQHNEAVRVGFITFVRLYTVLRESILMNLGIGDDLIE